MSPASTQQRRAPRVRFAVSNNPSLRSLSVTSNPSLTDRDDVIKEEFGNVWTIGQRPESLTMRPTTAAMMPTMTWCQKHRGQARTAAVRSIKRMMPRRTCKGTTRFSSNIPVGIAVAQIRPHHVQSTRASNSLPSLNSSETTETSLAQEELNTELILPSPGYPAKGMALAVPGGKRVSADSGRQQVLTQIQGGKVSYQLLLSLHDNSNCFSKQNSPTADGLELLSALAEKRPKCSSLDDHKRIFPSPSDSFKSDTAQYTGP
ncbi:hypothetical protein Btru_055266 [Bulinus truncatus]|nr:hypothetical protein Btru_055266 [Bulinus truncatus]